MTKKHILFPTLILFFSVSAAWLYVKTKKLPSQTPSGLPESSASEAKHTSQDPMSPQKSTSHEPLKSPEALQRASHSTETQIIDYTPLTAPSMKTYRAEVQENPHTPPESLLKFARDMGLRMEKAKTSEWYATQLMDDLKRIVITKQQATPLTAQSTSLVNARALAEKYPHLKAEYELMIQNANPRAIQLSQ